MSNLEAVTAGEFASLREALRFALEDSAPDETLVVHEALCDAVWDRPCNCQPTILQPLARC